MSYKGTKGQQEQHRDAYIRRRGDNHRSVKRTAQIIEQWKIEDTQRVNRVLPDKTAK